MVSSGWVAAVAIIGLRGLLADPIAQSSPQRALKADAKALMDKARDTYRNLPAYHFERVLLAEEADSDGKLTTIGQLTLTTATENAEPLPPGERVVPLNLARFRAGTKTPRGETLQVCDGQTCWSYTSSSHEYMMGRPPATCRRVASNLCAMSVPSRTKSRSPSAGLVSEGTYSAFVRVATIRASGLTSRDPTYRPVMSVSVDDRR